MILSRDDDAKNMVIEPLAQVADYRRRSSHMAIR